MTIREKLEGQRFGRLLVEEYKPEIKKYRCTCDCGNTTFVTSTCLKKGTTKSCGCLSRELASARKHFKNLSGQRFGSLVVIGKEPEVKMVRKKYRTYWLCRCDCGREIEVLARSLISGTTKSCGCGRYVDLTGQRFGRLTVVEKARDYCHDSPMWVCQCDCGRTVEVNGYSLKYGAVQSCGCLQKETARETMKAIKGGEPGTDLSHLTDKPQKNSQSGVRGVYPIKSRKAWEVSLQIKGEMPVRKSFSNFDEAVEARKEAEEEYFAPILEKHGRKLGE